MEKTNQYNIAYSIIKQNLKTFAKQKTAIVFNPLKHTNNFTLSNFYSLINIIEIHKLQIDIYIGLNFNTNLFKQQNYINIICPTNGLFLNHIKHKFSCAKFYTKCSNYQTMPISVENNFIAATDYINSTVVLYDNHSYMPYTINKIKNILY